MVQMLFLTTFKEALVYVDEKAFLHCLACCEFPSIPASDPEARVNVLPLLLRAPQCSFFFLAWAFLWWELVSREEVAFVFALFPVAFKPTLPSVTVGRQSLQQNLHKAWPVWFFMFRLDLAVNKIFNTRLSSTFGRIIGTDQLWHLAAQARDLKRGSRNKDTPEQLYPYNLIPYPSHDSLDPQPH